MALRSVRQSSAERQRTPPFLMFDGQIRIPATSVPINMLKTQFMADNHQFAHGVFSL